MCNIISKFTRKQYEEWLNILGVPINDSRPNKRTQNYGTWLRKNDPIAFEVGYKEWAEEQEYQKVLREEQNGTY